MRTNPLVAYWGIAADKWKHPRTRPYIHPDDRAYFETSGLSHGEGLDRNLDFHSYMHHHSFGKIDSQFHFSLLPLPYMGNLAQADIFVLLLNPGFDHVDLYAQQDTAFRHSVIRNLKQDFSDEEFPFAFLNPNYCWHGGFVYWERRLRGVLRFLADHTELMGSVANDRFGSNYYKALKSMASRLAAIELVPYHSRSFNADRLAQKLPTARAARDFVLDSLVPRACKGEILLINTRPTRWGIRQPSSSCIWYKGYETRGAFLSPITRGGKAIANWIKTHTPK